MGFQFTDSWMLIETKFEVSEKFHDFFAALAQTLDFPNLDSTGARQTLRITEPAKTLPKISLLRFFGMLLPQALR